MDPSFQDRFLTGLFKSGSRTQIVSANVSICLQHSLKLERTDLLPNAVATAASSPVFQSLSKEGILLESFYAVTHPSEPNYVAAVGGDFFGAADDNFCE